MKQINENDSIAINGGTGEIFLNPSKEEWKEFEGIKENSKKEKEKLLKEDSSYDYTLKSIDLISIEADSGTVLLFNDNIILLFEDENDNLFSPFLIDIEPVNSALSFGTLCLSLLFKGLNISFKIS